MTDKFKKGDRVRAVRPTKGWSDGPTIPVGTVRTVEEIDKWGAANTGYTLWIKEGIYKAEDFAYVFDPGGEPIEFSDIKVGDTIAAFTFNQWRVAEVNCMEHWGVFSKGDGVIAYNDGNTKEVRLLHRPVPPVDPVQVAAVQKAIETIPYAPLRDLGIDYDDVDFKPLAEALVKAGVTINTKEDA